MSPKLELESLLAALLLLLSGATWAVPLDEPPVRSREADTAYQEQRAGQSARDPATAVSPLKVEPISPSFSFWAIVLLVLTGAFAKAMHHRHHSHK